jgi:hypothetical protein
MMGEEDELGKMRTKSCHAHKIVVALKTWRRVVVARKAGKAVVDDAACPMPMTKLACCATRFQVSTEQRGGDEELRTPR